MEPIILTINDNEQNMDNILQRYNQQLERIAEIDITLFSNPTIEKFYSHCVNSDDIPVDEFLQMFHIEDKDKFFKEAQKECEMVKKQAYDNYKANNNFVLNLKFNDLSKANINKMFEYIEMAKTIHGDKIQIIVKEPENGFDKTCLLSLLEFSQSVDLRFQEIDEYQGNVTLSQVIEAYDLMEKELERIAKLDLSPFEKFLFAHDFASNKIYKSECNMDGSSSRTFINAMTTGDIVCVGYANIMQKFCERMGIHCEVISGEPEREGDEEARHLERIFHGGKGGGHCANLVYLKDEKYGIDGYYFCDACWDSKKEEGQEYKNYFYSALPLQDVGKTHEGKYFEKEIKNKDLPKISKPISMNNYERALNNLYSQIDNNFNEVSIRKNINFTKIYSSVNCEWGASNCFKQEGYLRE